MSQSVDDRSRLENAYHYISEYSGSTRREAQRHRQQSEV